MWSVHHFRTGGDEARASTGRRLSDRGSLRRGGGRPFPGRAATPGRDSGVDLELDFIEVETGRFDGEIEIEALERLKLDAEAPIVPGSELREPVVGDHERATLSLAEMLERDCRDLAQAQPPGGEGGDGPRERRPFPLIKTGTLNPKAAMLSAMRAIWRGR